MSFFKFFKKTSNQSPLPNFYHDQYVTLPQNFAQRVMDLQMQIQQEQSCSIDTVKQLNQLYSMAIQYYARDDENKVEHFHRKLTSLLVHPNALSVMENTRNKKDNRNYKINGNGYAKHLNRELNKFILQSDVLVQSMIEGNNRKAERITRLVTENMENQQEKLMRRIEERSRSKSKRNQNRQGG